MYVTLLGSDNMYGTLLGSDNIYGTLLGSNTKDSTLFGKAEVPTFMVLYWNVTTCAVLF